MSIKLGNTDFSDIYLGSTSVSKIYQGATEIYASTPPFVNPALTFGSSVTTQTNSPFIGGDGSYLFNYTTNSFINTTSISANFDFGTDDFTTEWFQYRTATLAGGASIYRMDNYPTVRLGVAYANVDELWFYGGGVEPPKLIITDATTLNVWEHWAIVRISGTTTFYKNGIQVGQITVVYNAGSSSHTFFIGSSANRTLNTKFEGYITNLRVVKGLGVYTGTFTVPTSDLQAVQSANPYGGLNTTAIPVGSTKLLLTPGV